jgi:hypothetical protein
MFSIIISRYFRNEVEGAIHSTRKAIANKFNQSSDDVLDIRNRSVEVKMCQQIQVHLQKQQ